MVEDLGSLEFTLTVTEIPKAPISLSAARRLGVVESSLLTTFSYRTIRMKFWRNYA